MTIPWLRSEGYRAAPAFRDVERRPVVAASRRPALAPAGSQWPRRLVHAALALAALSGAAPLLAQPVQPSPPAASPAAPSDSPPAAPAAPSSQVGADGAPAARPVMDEAAKAEAKKKADEIYKAAKKLFDKGDHAAALARYQAAFRTYPTRSARLGEGFCLLKLKRWDEALDVLDAALRDHGAELPSKTAEEVRRQIDLLRAETGAVMVTGAEVDALIVIDGRLRGRHPISAPLPLLEGTHLVRIYKEGFALLEKSVEVAKGKTETLAVKLAPLAAKPSGRLRVSEIAGAKMEVVVDGVPVGVTPWEGPVSAGEHTVVLRPLAPPPERQPSSTCGEPAHVIEQTSDAEATLATAPKRVVVQAGRTTPLPLKAEALSAWMRVSPVPGTASLSIDGASVGRGGFEGRLPPGEHEIDLSADGYLPEKRRVTLQAGEDSALSISMTRDPASPLWAERRELAVELQVGAPLAPSFGGDLAGACTGDCKQSLGAGARVALRGSYEVAHRIEVGFTLGYLGLEQSVRDREITLRLGGSNGGGALGITTRDAIAIQGFLGGALVAYRLGQRFPIHVGLAAGVGLGSISDTRLGSGAYAVGPVVQSGFFPWIFVEPELRAGVRVTGHLTASVSLSALILAFPGVPQWSGDMKLRALGAEPGDEQTGTFAPETIASRGLFALTPGLSLRYDL